MSSETVDLVTAQKSGSIVGRLAIATQPAEAVIFAHELPKSNRITTEDYRGARFLTIPTGTVVMVIDVITEGRWVPGKVKVLHNERACYVSGKEFRLISIKDVFSGKSFCITGELSKPREYFKTFIKLKGGKFKPSLSAKVDYLICGEQTRIVGVSTKQKKAEQLGIPIITERQFYKMFVDT